MPRGVDSSGLRILCCVVLLAERSSQRRRRVVRAGIRPAKLRQRRLGFVCTCTAANNSAQRPPDKFVNRCADSAAIGDDAANSWADSATECSTVPSHSAAVDAPDCATDCRRNSDDAKPAPGRAERPRRFSLRLRCVVAQFAGRELHRVVTGQPVRALELLP